MKKKVDIRLKVSSDVFESIKKFNKKNSLTDINLNYIPFNHFVCEILEQCDTKTTEEEIDYMIANMNLPKERLLNAKKRLLDEYRTKSMLLDMIVDIDSDNNHIEIEVESTAKISIALHNSIIKIGSVDEIFQSVKSLNWEPISPTLKMLMSSLESEVKRFEDFCICTILNIWSLLAYISADKKLDMSTDTLFVKREYLTKESKSKKSKKKKAKSSISIIKHVEYLISNDIVISNVKRNIHKKYQRHTDEWFTKGFWRTCKSGKKVWIKPHIKRAKDSINKASKIEKTYVVS